MFAPRLPKKAFTLVELLVVIGIIALLISILLPSLNKARGSANNLKCQSNLRQIGIAIRMYCGAFKDTLPIGTWDGGPYQAGVRTANGCDFTTLLSPYVGKKGGQNWGDNTSANVNTNNSSRGVFSDVDTVEGDTNITNTIYGTQPNFVHYSAHPRMMGRLDQWNGPSTTPGLHLMIPYKLSKVQPSAETILIFDGTQIAANGWNASVEAFAVDNFGVFLNNYYMRRDYAQRFNVPINVSIDPGPNVEARTFGDRSAGDIRWRHAKNTQANFLFCDNHVETKSINKAKRTSDCKKSNWAVVGQDRQ